MRAWTTSTEAVAFGSVGILTPSADIVAGTVAATEIPNPSRHAAITWRNMRYPSHHTRRTMSDSLQRLELSIHATVVGLFSTHSGQALPINKLDLYCRRRQRQCRLGCDPPLLLGVRSWAVPLGISSGSA